MNKKLLYIVLMLATCMPFCAAQENMHTRPLCTSFPEPAGNNLLRMHSTMLATGYRHALDTYLSQENYTGTEVRLLRENMRMTRIMNGCVSVQNMMQGNFAYMHSRSEDGKELSGLFDWNATWHYNHQICPALRLQLGGGIGFHGGFVYNMRNGNNPAQARLSTDINLSAAAIYKLRLAGKTIALRYQAEVPLIGLMFSPNYGQSYYEIFSLGHYDHNVCITHPFQALTFNQLLTADIPFNRIGTFRIGYLGAIRQHRVNKLKIHDWSHLLLIGYVKNFYLVKDSNATPSKKSRP